MFLPYYIFNPFSRFSSLTYSPEQPIATWLAMKLPVGLRSFARLRIRGGVPSGYCVCLFHTTSIPGLTCCPSSFFSATSGVGGASSSCILRSRAASSDFNCFSSSSFFHTLPAISCNCGISRSSTSFFALYWSMMEGMRSSALRKFRAAATGSAIADVRCCRCTCSFLQLRNGCR